MGGIEASPMQNIDVDSASECSEVGGEWDDREDVCWEFKDEGFGQSAPVDGVMVSYNVVEYDFGFIPMARIEKPDGAILDEFEGHEKQNEYSAMTSAKNMATGTIQDLRRTRPGNVGYDDLKKYEIGRHEVIARSREEALDTIREATEADLPRGQQQF